MSTTTTTTTTTKDELRVRLQLALTEVTAAERVLETTLRELGQGGPRAEKVAVTADVANAFSRLRRAHEELSKLQEIIDSE